ncbi:MAG: SRPBCC family protein [Candidatus Azobacteroides sp.]|nr:SRPBCC family protein [Candidatus Azobacteroides sp.]
MTEYTSEIKIIPYNREKVYGMLSNLEHLEKLKEQFPGGKINDMTFEKDSFSFVTDQVGKVKFAIIEREPSQTIQMQAEQSPLDVRLWIQLAESSENETAMKLIVKADLNPLLKPMLSNPLQKGVDKIAQILSAIPYNDLE